MTGSNHTSLSDLSRAVVILSAEGACAITRELLASGVAPADILNQGLIPGMDEIGRRFRLKEYFVPEVLVAARAMSQAMEILQPELVAAGVKPCGRVVIGTVQGDIHDIGKNLVRMMLEGGGFEVVDLGVDIPPERFVEAAREGVDAVCMSALLTTTLRGMRNTVDALEEAGIRDRLIVMAGGAPLTPQEAHRQGADGYAADAALAVAELKRLLSPKS